MATVPRVGMSRRARRIVVNPKVPDLVPADICECIAKTACEGVPELVASLLLAPTTL
jgi:hypothetical protein